ncbi:hypothetical protein pb186bvf_012401 [Paramecium bursaria]
MQSQGNFSQIYSQLSKSFQSVESKTQSLELMDVDYMSEKEFMVKIQQMAQETPLFNIILKYKNLFSLLPSFDMVASLSDLTEEAIIHEKIGAGGNAQVFLSTDLLLSKHYALKTMENVNINLLEFYIQECINQYHLIQINKDQVLNFKGLVYIKIVNSQASIYIPLELAEYSLFEYIQNNEITEETYQYFYKLLIDILILLHSNNYAHRDIKPQNILFIKEKGWKLADFGESIKYEERNGLYKIQGTIAFLPQNIRKQINKSKQVIQDLYKNDIYAVMCTLVMIKNPKFKSEDLVKYMDTQKFDQNLEQLQQITYSDGSVELLYQVKVPKFAINMELFKANFNLISQKVYFNIEDRLIYYYQIVKPLGEDFIIFIDNELKIRKNDLNQDLYQKLALYMLLFHPFQICNLQNFQFDSQIHNNILERIDTYFNSKFEIYIYLKQFQYGFLIKDFLNQAIVEQNQSLLLSMVDENIRSGNLQIAKKLLQISGKFILNDPNFDSDLFIQYNSLYFRIHGQAPLIDESNILDSYFNNINVSSQFNLEQYLNSNKVLYDTTLNLIILLRPLFCQELDDQTLNIVSKHIISSLGLSETAISEDKFQLSNNILTQLISGGNSFYSQYMYQIILGAIKLLQHLDQFEGLLQLLHYFRNFMKYINPFIYNWICSSIQNLIFKLNFPIYHLEDDSDDQSVKRPIVKSKDQYIVYLGLNIYQIINNLQSSLIKYHQKTDQEIKQINLNQIEVFLSKVMIENDISISNHFNIFKLVQQYASVLGQIEQNLQIYLRISIQTICKLIYGGGFYQNQVILDNSKQQIKQNFDIILLKYFIYCKQDNRIIELINLWTKSRITTHINNELVKLLLNLILMKTNNILRYNIGFVEKKIIIFAIKQKFRYLYNFKQHLYVANVSKTLKTRLNVHNLCLREQYLGIH